MVNDRQTLSETLRGLPYAERSRILQESLQAALERMPDEQSQQVTGLARELADKVNKLGPATAVEVLAAIGMLWNENGHGR